MTNKKLLDARAEIRESTELIRYEVNELSEEIVYIIRNDLSWWKTLDRKEILFSLGQLNILREMLSDIREEESFFLEISSHFQSRGTERFQKEDFITLKEVIKKAFVFAEKKEVIPPYLDKKSNFTIVLTKGIGETGLKLITCYIKEDVKPRRDLSRQKPKKKKRKKD